MTTISVFYQGEGVNGFERLETAAGGTLADVHRAILGKHGLAADVLLFLEEAEEPAEPSTPLVDLTGPKGLKVHVHRCRRIEVSVTFNSTREHAFAPSATIARVKRWATETAFPMSPEEAGEHVLQISGTDERPSPGTHLGTLTSCPACRVSFDLVPNERVNGGPDSQA